MGKTDNDRNKWMPERTADTVFGWIWSVLCVSALCGAVFAGAWWHLVTAAVAGLFAWMNFAEVKELENE